MGIDRISISAAAAVLALGSTLTAQAVSIPSVVVTVKNAQPDRGTFLTPPWIAIHDGTFDSYDGGSAASVPLGGNEIEALAEDGNNGPISATFAALLPNAPQVEGLAGPGGPLGPGARASVTLNVDPTLDRYFSYASMVIPSNDAFIANGNPLAHQLFDTDGDFVGEAFIVSGDETNDAGTEINDELAPNVAFLAQAAPNTGDDENGVVVTPSSGFAEAGTLAFPNGVLNHPVFANGDFNDADDRLFEVSFRYVNLGSTLRFRNILTTTEEIQADIVNTGATGRSSVIARQGERVTVRARTRNLSGPITMAHLHLGAAGTNGGVIVDLGEGISNNGRRVSLQITAEDLIGDLEGAEFLELLNQMAAGNVYLNIHTEAFPAGELRAQLSLN